MWRSPRTFFLSAPAIMLYGWDNTAEAEPTHIFPFCPRWAQLASEGDEDYEPKVSVIRVPAPACPAAKAAEKSCKADDKKDDGEAAEEKVKEVGKKKDDGKLADKIEKAAEKSEEKATKAADKMAEKADKTGEKAGAAEAAL